MGFRHLPQPPADRRTPEPSPRSVAAGGGPAARADFVDHGRDPAHRHSCRPCQSQSDDRSRVRRLGDATTPADHPGRRAGDPDRRRSAPVPRRTAPGAAAGPGRRTREAGSRAARLRRQHQRRFSRSAGPRIPDPPDRPQRAHRGSAEPGGHRQERPADRSQAARRRQAGAGDKARRRKFPGQAGGDSLGAEATGRRQRVAHSRSRESHRRTRQEPARRHRGAVLPLQAGRFHRALGEQRRRGTARWCDPRRGDSLPVPAQRAHDDYFADGDSRIAAGDGAGLPLLRPVDQHHDPRRAGDCDWRTGRRRCRRRRKCLAPPARHARSSR